MDNEIKTEHVAVVEDWSTQYSMTLRTRWYDTKKQADLQADTYRANGADLTRVMREKSKILGKYKVVGYFPTLRHLDDCPAFTPDGEMK